MKQCTYCGAELQDDARACNNCGRPVPGMQEPEQKELTKSEDTTEPAEEQAAPSTEDRQDPWEQQSQPQDPWGQQSQPQDPWGQQGWTQDPYGQQGQPQNPWGQQGQPQSPWGQQSHPQNPWTRPDGQNGWNTNQQGNWGWQQNGPMPQGYGQYPVNGNQTNIPGRYNTFAIWSLVFGVLASFLNGLVFVPSIIAIIFAVVGLVQIRKNPGLFRGKWMAIAGLAFGVFFLIVYGYVFHVVFQAVQNPETFEQLQQYLKEINAIK